jgi:hypothetical protein
MFRATSCSSSGGQILLTLSCRTTYRYICRTAPLTSRCCILYIIQQIYVQNILNMMHALRFFFSSKCRLFHNATFFGSCVIHIIYTVCAKIKKKNSGAKGLIQHLVSSLSVSGCLVHQMAT